MTHEFSAPTRNRITRLVEEVAPELSESDSADRDALEVFACAAWSGMGEPGDRMVHLLCDALGALEALQQVISGASAGELTKRIGLDADIGAGADGDLDLEAAIGEALGRWKPRLSEREALAHLERAGRIGAQLITEKSKHWPRGLGDLGQHRPIALWTRGNLETLATLDSSIAMVGARASTGYGEHVTMELTSGLVDRGFAIVSGAAYGIDGMAHRATIASGGATVAVLAGGIDRLYPSGHDALLHRIIETGLVVTDLPCGFAPTKWRFLQRNRLIAAASTATVVVEAGWRSGSLNTAHHALELDRPLGAVPGPVTSASSAGCHRLLRETPAVCVTTAEEIIALTPEAFERSATIAGSMARADAEPGSVHPFATRVLDAMSERRGRTIDELARLSGLSAAETLAVVGLLELTGMVHEVPTGWKKQSA